MKISFELTNDLLAEPRLITPYTGIDNSITWEKLETPIFDYSLKVKDLTFVGEDFDYFLALEKSSNNCDLQTLNIKSSCGLGIDTFTLFTGTFSMSSGSWDLDKCTVKFKIDFDDAYKCIEDNLSLIHI